MSFRFILAMDNDPAGLKSIQRFLEGHIQDIDLPYPHPDEMSLMVYEEWLRTLNVTELSQELIRLRDSEYAGADKALALTHEFEYCKAALAYKQHQNKYFRALKGL